MVTFWAHIPKLVVRFNPPHQINAKVKRSFTTHVDFKEKVYLESEPEVIRTVSGFLVREGSITIGVVKGENESWHQPFEVIPYKSKVFVIKGFKK
jgi:hypothetical protein